MGRLFGTDGIRGIANQTLSCELALSVGRAASAVLSKNKHRRSICVIGMDTRISSDMLLSALTAGLCSVGTDVINLGVVPTPAVAYLAGKYKADMGIMISASHNTAEFNGIKIFSGDGYKLPDALEEEIEDIILNGRGFTNAAAGDLGTVSYAANAVRDYIDYIKSTVSHTFEGISVAADCANGSAAVTAGKLLGELGAGCHVLFDKPDGLNINRDCGSTHMGALAEYVIKHKLDAGFAFDGDADRFLCVDENGTLIDGDQIMAVCALDLKERGKLHKNSVVGTIMSNLGFLKFCEQNGINFEAAKVGDRFVLEQMLLEDYCFGGEQSGHIIFRDFATTGDGQLSAVQLLSVMRRKGTKLSELVKIMTRFPQVSINLPVSNESKVAFYTDPDIKDAVEKAKKLLGENGRIVLRPSGTEPVIRIMTEGEDMEKITEIANDTAAVISRKLT